MGNKIKHWQKWEWSEKTDPILPYFQNWHVVFFYRFFFRNILRAEKERALTLTLVILWSTLMMTLVCSCWQPWRQPGLWVCPWWNYDDKDDGESMATVERRKKNIVILRVYYSYDGDIDRSHDESNHIIVYYSHIVLFPHMKPYHTTNHPSRWSTFCFGSCSPSNVEKWQHPYSSGFEHVFPSLLKVQRVACASPPVPTWWGWPNLSPKCSQIGQKWSLE